MLVCCLFLCLFVCWLVVVWLVRCACCLSLVVCRLLVGWLCLLFFLRSFVRSFVCLFVWFYFWYCWWKKSFTSWYVLFLISYLPTTVDEYVHPRWCRISSINSGWLVGWLVGGPPGSHSSEFLLAQHWRRSPHVTLPARQRYGEFVVTRSSVNFLQKRGSLVNRYRSFIGNPFKSL